MISDSVKRFSQGGSKASTMRYLVRTLATLEIIGGTYNLGFVATYLSQVTVANAPYKSASIIVGCVGIAVNIVAIVAGVELWKGTPFGRRLSLVVQVIQLPKLFLPVLIFSFAFGPETYVVLKLRPDSELYFTITGQPIGQQLLYFLVESTDRSFGIGVSLVACAWIVVLRGYHPEASAEPIANPALTRMQRFFCWAVAIGGLCSVVTDLAATYLGPHMDYGNPNFPEALNAAMRRRQTLQVSSPLRAAAFGVPAAMLGFFCLRAKRWAFWLLFLMFLPQTIEYISNEFSFSLMGPWRINFGISRADPPTQLNINFLAIIVCVLAAGTALSLRRRHAEEPEAAGRIEPSF